jgi:O-methyltransferase involved in polyketide biosynthesis
MSDLKKLQKQVQKTSLAVVNARAVVNRAVEAFEDAVAERAIAREQLEQAEALEAARELRGKAK